MEDNYPLALPEGAVLGGQYIIRKVLGQGGFGITYMAEDHKTGQKVAVKEFFPDTLASRTQNTVSSYPGERMDSFQYGKTCFLQEAETLAAFIGSENIVKIHSYFEENGTAYFVMDFVEGISFDEYIKQKGGKISYEEAEKVLLPIIDALALVHSKGIVHRDVTPDNIYITSDGTVKLLDFGAARYSLGDKSRSLDVVLKHGFAPKEQYTRHGRQGPFTDVYTVGASFYFAITGKRPPDSIDRLEEDDLVTPSSLGVEIPKQKEEAILKAMSVQPGDRFQTMGEFKNALLAGSAAQAIQPAGVTNQRVFTAPVQPAQTQPQAVQVQLQPQPIQPQLQQAAVQAPAVPKKLNKPVLVAAIGGAAAVLLIAVVLVCKVFSGIVGGPGSGLDSPEEAFEAWFNGLAEHDFDKQLEAYPDFWIEFQGGEKKVKEALQSSYEDDIKPYVDMGYTLHYEAVGHTLLSQAETERIEENLCEIFQTDVKISAAATIDYVLHLKNDTLDQDITSEMLNGGYSVKYKGKWYYFNIF